MSIEDMITDDFLILEEESQKVAEEVAAYQRKLMEPVWYKRREMAKKIDNFWGQAIGNSPLFAMETSENDIEALEHLTDFHVEFDHAKPNYRKIVATFKKNDVFKNETLTKEFSIDPEEEGSVISKATIEYHNNKTPNKKRKADEDDELSFSFLEWFGDDDVRTGILLSEDIFPNAVEYFQGPEEDDEDGEDEDDIELGSDESDEEEEETPKAKKQKK